MVTLPETTDVEAEELNDSLHTLYSFRHRRWQPTPSITQVDVQPGLHHFLIMRLPWSRFTLATYSITWTSLVELDQLTLTAYLRSLKPFNQSIWTVIFLACFQYVLITERTFNSKHAKMCHMKRSSIKL